MEEITISELEKLYWFDANIIVEYEIEGFKSLQDDTIEALVNRVNRGGKNFKNMNMKYLAVDEKDYKKCFNI